MTSFAQIKKCFELSDEIILAAVESREDTHALLKHLAKIAEPNSGAAKVLVLFARMGTSACEWFDGDLRVDVRDGGGSCTIEVTAELGMGMRERIFPAIEYAVPLEEMTRAVERVPDRIRPLKVIAHTAKSLTLGVTAAVRQTSLPPPPIKIAEDSFFTPASLKPLRAPVIDARAPTLPLVHSTRKIKVAKKVSSAPPKAKSVPPKAKSMPPKAKSLPPKAKSIRPAKPVLERPPLPRPKPRAASEERAVPPLPIVEPGLPLVMPESSKMKSKRPSKGPAKAGRLSLEARIGQVEDEEEVDSGWEDD